MLLLVDGDWLGEDGWSLPLLDLLHCSLEGKTSTSLVDQYKAGTPAGGLMTQVV
jgi:hypothetical protein